MSGRRQHFIPQFLQRGFAIDASQPTQQCWVYKSARDPFRCSIKNIGVSKDFYSTPEDSLLDDLITEDESNIYSRVVNTLRENKDVAQVERGELLGLLCHLQLRTRNLRESVSFIGHLAMKKMKNLLSDFRFMKSLLLKMMQNNPDRLLISLGIDPLHSPINRDELLLFMKVMMESDESDEMIRGFANSFAQKGHELDELVSIAAQSVHKEKLMEDAPLSYLKEILNNLSYSVEAIVDLPLGDSIIVYQIDGDTEPEYRTHLSINNIVRNVILPLNSNTALIGTIKGFELSDSDIREAIMICSSEFFIASEVKPVFVEGACLIGTKLNVIGEEELAAGLASISMDNFP